MGTHPFGRRHIEPLARSVQVLIDLGAILLACWMGFETREYFAWGNSTNLEDYRAVFLLTAVVTLGSFYAWGMYGQLTRPGLWLIAKSTFMSFLIVYVLFLMLRGATNLPENGIYGPMAKLPLMLGMDQESFRVFSRLVLVMAFVYVFALTAASRFVSFRAIQHLRHRGVG